MQDLALPSYVHGKIWLHTAQFLVWFFLLVPFFWTPCSWVTYYSGYSYQSSIKLNFKLILFIWDYHLNLHFLMWSIYEKLIYFDWLGHQEPKKLAHCETPSPIIRQSLKKKKKIVMIVLIMLKLCWNSLESYCLWRQWRTFLKFFSTCVIFQNLSSQVNFNDLVRPHNHLNFSNEIW